MNISDKFWSTVNKTENCWIWTGPKLNSDYGVFYGPEFIDSTPAHRVSWFLAKGDLAKGFDICHVCDVKLCVNPSHLFKGTRKENIHDMMQKGRMVCRQPRSAPCHPNRKHFAKNLCHPCYKRKWRLKCM